MKNSQKIVLFILIFFYTSLVKAQLQINTAMTPQQLVANVLVGGGVQVFNVTYNSPSTALNIGEFNNGNLTNIGLNHGIILASGNVNNALGPNNSTSKGNTTSSGSDPQLQALIPSYTINDAAVLQFDFIPLSDTIKFRYVFASEEYPEFVCSNFNDVFGFFVSGINPAGGNYNNYNIARIPGTNLPVTINSLNSGLVGSSGSAGGCTSLAYSAYYVDNTGGVSIQYDGFTTVLTAYIVVQPCTQYHMKIGVADAGDSSYDSAVFLEANSFTSNAITVSTDFSTPGAIPMAIEGCNDAIIKFTLPYAKADTFFVVVDSIYGTATNGVDFPFIGNTIAIPPGQTSTTLTISPIMDNIVEPIEYVTIRIKSTICTKDSVTIPIMSYKPIAVTAISDTMICQDLSLNASAQLAVYPQYGATPYQIIWQPALDLNNPNIANPLATPAIGNHTNFKVSVTDSTGCPGDTASVNVIVNEAPNVSFLPMPFPASGCAPLSVNFVDESTPVNHFNEWIFGDGGTDTALSPVHVYQNPGSYTVVLKVSTPEGCKGETNLPNVVNVYPNPVASFTATPQIAPISNSLITFNSSASSPNVTSWYWNFGDPGSSDNNSILQNIVHAYSTNGLYTIWLNVATIYNCVDSVSLQVRIIEDSLVFPNIITPNGDGLNDYFNIKNLEYYITNKLLIFNRWGKIVYEKEPYIPANDRWDGEGLPDGTYFYIIKFQGYLSEGEQKGSITILR